MRSTGLKVMEAVYIQDTVLMDPKLWDSLRSSIFFLIVQVVITICIILQITTNSVICGSGKLCEQAKEQIDLNTIIIK